MPDRANRGECIGRRAILAAAVASGLTARFGVGWSIVNAADRTTGSDAAKKPRKKVKCLPGERTRGKRCESIYTFTGYIGPTGSPGQPNFVTDMAVDTDNTILVADVFRKRTRRLAADGALLREFSGPVDDWQPFGVDLESTGNIVVLDGTYGRQRIVTLTPAGIVIDTVDLPLPPTSMCQGLAVTPAGDFLLSDVKLHKLYRFSTQGMLLGSAGGAGRRPDQFRDLGMIAVGPDGVIYAVNRGADPSIKTFNANLQFLDEWPTSDPVPEGSKPDLVVPCGIVVKNGRVVIGDGTGLFRVFTTTGKLVARGGVRQTRGSLQPSGVAVANDGAVLVFNRAQHRIGVNVPRA